MYLISRTASFARLFFLLSLCGLIMYVVLAFYTFHVAFSSVTRAEITQQKLKNYPIPYIDNGIRDSDLKYILLWTIPDFKYKLPAHGQTTFIDNDCDFTNCYITTNKSLLNDVTKFNAIVFSISTLRRWKRYLPQKRSPNQKFVFYSTLPANDNPVCNINSDNYFNWTWTYKLYSDIFTPFIEVRNMNGNVIAPHFDVEWPSDMICTLNSTVSKPKSKTLMWFNEKCDSTHQKLFVKGLRKHMKEHSLVFDVYGCGVECPKGGCLKAIEEDYSFYLAYENSISEDYVSKEVLKGLQHNAVPVVVGGADYTKFLPPGSYIDARYETPERLASLLEYITRNPASYNKYFAWKNYYAIHEADPRKGYCQLCSLLNDKKRTENHSAYETFRKWWYDGNLHDKCYPKGAETFDAVLSYIEDKELRKSLIPGST